jgi:hypothetical protein
MPHAIIRGANGRRHEVDFGDAPVRVEIYASEETVEIFIGADFETLPEEGRRFALLNIPRHLFSEATAAAARRATKPGSGNPALVRYFGRFPPADKSDRSDISRTRGRLCASALLRRWISTVTASISL